MTVNRSERLATIHNQLIKISQDWALRRSFDPSRARELRKEAILENHAHYLGNIPAYRKLALEEGIDKLTGIDLIKRHLMLSDDIFKSYSQQWLNDSDFARMNEWLSEIHHKRINTDSTGIESIDQWIEHLDKSGCKMVYSSGTSGTFSFVPRDEMNWQLLKTVNTCCLAPLLMHDKMGAFWHRSLIKIASKLLSPNLFEIVIDKMGAPDFDGVFLGFKNGKMGMQTIGQELASLFRRHCFLYEVDLEASALRCLTHGTQTEDDQMLLEKLQIETVERKNPNYLRIINNMRQSTTEGQKVFVFGAPYQFKELCEFMSHSGEQVNLKQQSLIVFGGGWKSFTGDTISREALIRMISDNFAVPPEMILEGYSMTEINVFMLRCEQGRFHIPPTIEPVIFDEELSPLEGKNLRGVLGFLDPFAVSYPGFIISGDKVRLTYDECACGLSGPSLTEIGRTRGKEVTGCGGMMASVKV